MEYVPRFIDIAPVKNICLYMFFHKLRGNIEVINKNVISFRYAFIGWVYVRYE